MMTKRPLGGKKARLLATDRTTEKIGQRLGAPIEQGAVAEELRLLIGEVHPEPDQHRGIKMNMAILKDPNSAPDTETRLQAESIIGLSQSIQSMGQITPIDVYQEGKFYRIIEGERRYWAIRLAGLQQIRAFVRYSKPDYVYALQLGHNMQREQVRLRGQMVLVRRVWQEAADRGRPIESAAELSKRTGLKKTVSYRWWRLLIEGKEIEDAILDKRIRWGSSIDYLLSLKPSEREAAIKILSESELPETDENDEAARMAHIKKKITGAKLSSSSKRSPGRPPVMRLVQTTNTTVARAVYECLSGEDGETIDWTNPKAAVAACKDALAKLEQRLSLKKSKQR